MIKYITIGVLLALGACTVYEQPADIVILQPQVAQAPVVVDNYHREYDTGDFYHMYSRKEVRW